MANAQAVGERRRDGAGRYVEWGQDDRASLYENGIHSVRGPDRESPDYGVTLYEMLGRMPFLDRLELAHLYGISPTTCYRYLDLMERSGFVGWVNHAARYLRSSRRYYLTRQGLRVLRGIAGDGLADRYPLSRAWRRMYAQRMDSMVSIYRFASSLAVETGIAPVFVNPCARGPWDAMIEMPNGLIVGALRQGIAMSRYAIKDRFWRMSSREGGPPALTLVLACDETERAEVSKRLAEFPELPALVTSEYDALDAERADSRWSMPGARNEGVGIREIADWIECASPVPRDFSEYWRWSARDSMTGFGFDGEFFEGLPAFCLSGTEKTLLDLIHDWPLSLRAHFMSMLDIKDSRLTTVATGLVENGLARIERIGGERIRYALTDAGIMYLCRRDRVEVKGKLNRLSSALKDGDYRGGSLRVIAKEIEHNDGINRFLDALWSDPAGLWRGMTVQPTSRARRQFTHEGRSRMVMPDAVVELVSADGRKLQAMVEYERRAKSPSSMSRKVVPYRRYFEYGAVREDFDGTVVVLFVLSSVEQETVFARAVWRERERTGVSVPFLCATVEELERDGPFGAVWRVAQDEGEYRRVRLADVVSV